MPATVATPQDFIESIERYTSERYDGDAFWLLDVSDDKIVFFELQFTRFGVYAETRSNPDIAFYYDQNNLRDELEHSLGFYFETVRPEMILIMGSLAVQDPMIANVMSNAYDVKCYLLSETGVYTMPKFRILRDFLRKQPGRLSFDLELLAIDSQDLLPTRDLRNGEYMVHWQNITLVRASDQTEVYPRGRLGQRHQFFAPQAYYYTKMFFNERDPITNQVERQRIYTILPEHREIEFQIIFNGQDWDVEWRNARVVSEDIAEYAEIVEDNFEPQPVTVEIISPKILIVVEGALGMGLLLQQMQELPVEEESQLTDFTAVRELVRQILGIFERNWKSLVMFYHDTHNARPAEFTRADKRFFPQEKLTYLPDTGQFSDYDLVRQRVDEDFLAHQSVTLDWNKSLEEAVNKINQMDWYGNGIVVWIGQSPPHRFESPEQKPNESHYGFGSPLDFWELHKELKSRTNLLHVTFFISQDVPGAKSRSLNPLLRETRRYWEAFSEFKRFFELDLSNPYSQDLLPPQAYDRLADMEQELSQTFIIKPANNRLSLDLPFTHLDDTIQVIPVLDNS